MKVLILGVNGFIGNALARRLIARDGCEVLGLDLDADKLDGILGHPRFRFSQADISINRDWVEAAVRASDVVLPLVAIATPALYVKQPLRVFELDFEENLRVIRLCVRYRKRIVFPSTSEVYGMGSDAEFDEDTTPLIMGPISKQRWIYGCLKQLLDRVIWAYGFEKGLRFTIFRPFNWIGPKLDRIDDPKIGSSRVVTQFIGHIVRDEPIPLVDGGMQRRCYTYVSDGIDALMAIIENPGGACDGQIFNIGNPENECSVRDLARRLRRLYEEEFGGTPIPPDEALKVVESERFYGEGYQDLVHRKPSIRKARRLLGWTPAVGLDEALRRTLGAFLEDLGLAPPAPDAAVRQSRR